MRSIIIGNYQIAQKLLRILFSIRNLKKSKFFKKNKEKYKNHKNKGHFDLACNQKFTNQLKYNKICNKAQIYVYLTQLAGFLRQPGPKWPKNR